MRIPFEERRGILSGGNWIVDRVKIVDKYPARERLADILSESVQNGGASFNLLTDLARLEAPFPLAGIGLIGEDADGDLILSQCRVHAIDASGVVRLPGARTSFTDVVSEKESGKRTFFHSRGANALLDLEHFALESHRSRIFHLGYLMLLDRLDQIQADGRSKAYHLLSRARALGFKTAVDMVSAEDDSFAAKVASALPAVDILFLNEYEAEKTTGIRLRGDASLEISAVRLALEALIDMGVREWAILHCSGGAWALSASGEWVSQGAVRMPEESIRGTVGAGDAFAAGVLLGIHEERSMEACLAMGACAAAACLTSPGSSEGVEKMELCLHLGSRFGFRDMPEVSYSKQGEAS